jgi:hypothetical protein
VVAVREAPFRHEAFVYRTNDEYLEGLEPFVAAGVVAGDAQLVADELVKCQRHEALLNLAFAAKLWIMNRVSDLVQMRAVSGWQAILHFSI